MLFVQQMGRHGFILSIQTGILRRILLGIQPWGSDLLDLDLFFHHFGTPNPSKDAQDAKKVGIARAPGPYGGQRGIQSSPGRVLESLGDLQT